MIGYPTQVPMDGLSDQYFQYFLWIDGTIDSGRELLLASLLALAQQRPSLSTIYRQYGSHSIHILSYPPKLNGVAQRNLELEQFDTWIPSFEQPGAPRIGRLQYRQVTLGPPPLRVQDAA
jgi:hypothetical protein